MIENFYKYSEELASGAQPTEQEINELKNEGFEVVVNISTPSAKNALQNEGLTVEQAGMYYINFPVDCSNLQPIHYLIFKGIMDGITHKKTFVHCAGNVKSSNLIHMYDVLEKGADEKESLDILKSIQGQPEDKWFTYFEKMGIKSKQ